MLDCSRWLGRNRSYYEPESRGKQYSRCLARKFRIVLPQSLLYSKSRRGEWKLKPCVAAKRPPPTG